MEHTFVQVEVEVVQHLGQALRHLDLETGGARHQSRAAAVHHRLGSLHHHQYRQLLGQGGGQAEGAALRTRQIRSALIGKPAGHSRVSLQPLPSHGVVFCRQLSELHYSKAVALYTGLKQWSQAVRATLERAGLLEAGLDTSARSDSARHKLLLQVVSMGIFCGILLTR